MAFFNKFPRFLGGTNDELVMYFFGTAYCNIVTHFNVERKSVLIVTYFVDTLDFRINARLKNNF